MAFSSKSLIRGTRARQAQTSNEKLKANFNRNRNELVHLLQPLGIETEFLGHLDQLL